jgi:hypothetical protein
VKALREEARTGLRSSEVRRALIKEELRPTPRPVPTPPPPQSQSKRTTHLHTAQSARRLSARVEAGSSGDVLPAAWLAGDFQLDAFPDAASFSSSSETLSPLDRVTLPAVAECAMEGLKTKKVDAAAHADYASVLHSYEALCRAASEVAYDAPLEDKLRCVESRDGRTGVATSWIARRGSAPLLQTNPAVWQTAARGGGGAASPPATASAEEAMRRATSRNVTTTSHAFSHALYTPPPSSSYGNATFASPPTRSSVNSTASSSRQPSRSPSSAHSLRQPRKGSKSTTPTVSTVGTAVLRSSAANYATALRQLVKAQRVQTTVPDTWGRLTSSSFSSSVVEGEPLRAMEWRMRVAAAVTLAVCQSCGTMFPCTLAPDTATAGAEEGLDHQGGGEMKGDARDACGGGAAAAAVCPRCGQPVDVSAKTAGAVETCRWMLPPPPQTAAAPATTSIPSKEEEERVPMNQPSPQQASTEATASAADVSGHGNGCGTDSVGFAERDDKVPFAVLVARIRAARGDAAAHASSPPPQSARTTAATSTGTDAAEVQSDASQHGVPGASTAARVALSQLSSAVPLSRLKAPVSADPMASKLRTALSHLYYFELTRGGTKSGEDI